MAKREFIDKVKAKEIIASGKDDKAYFGLTSNDWKVIDFLNEVPTVTEQEIVKSHLEKLKKEIQQEAVSHSGTGEEVIQAYVDGLVKVMKMIDKTLHDINGDKNE